MKADKLHLIVFFLFFFFIRLDVNAQPKSDFEDISVLLQIEGINSTYSIGALYSPDGKLYISVEELFQVLIIPCVVNKDGDILSGFIENEKRLYEINYLTKQIKDDVKLYNCNNELVKNMGLIYLESSLFEKIFGLHLTFNFRSLAVKITSDFELPLIKKQRLEKIRSTIQKNIEAPIVDKIVKRDYHLFRYGTIDWSAMSSQSIGEQTDSRFGLSLGTELLFGEANVFLNFSDKNKLDSRQQQYYWRWVDNDIAVIRQVQAGNISNQTISSLNAPVHGATITNTPTTIRKAKGEYIISDVTQPDWFVELYINNALIDYTKADAAGQFMFKVPIVYGYTVLKLKFYGPMGEERTEERIMNVPSNFMPSGVFEYKLSAGVLQDDKDTRFGRGEGNYGVTRNFTIGGGVEYLSSINNLSSIPFVSASILPLHRLILNGEYAHKVRTKALLNYYLWSSAMFEIDYTKYTEGQKAILYNYLEERKVGLSIPMRYKNISGSTRISYKQNVYKNFTYNMADFMLSAFYRQFNANVSTYANWIDDKSVYIHTNAALSVRFSKGYSFRPSAQYNLSDNELISCKAELEKKVSKAGYCSVSYEKNIASNYNSLNVSFKYDFSFAQTNASVRVVNSDVSLMESVRGGLIFDEKNNRSFASQQSMVGRGGIAFIPFIDINHNGSFDPDERKAEGLSVRMNGGRAFFSEKDSIVRIMGLEPFVYYNVEVSDRDFEFITWRIKKKNYRILVDPNQFKNIEIPVSPVAEISGMVLFDNDSIKEGIGRVIVTIFKENGSVAAKTVTESDGYVSYLGLLPGNYYAKIDSVQLNRLQMEAKPSQVDFTIKALEEGDVFNGIDFVLSNKKVKEVFKTDTSLSQIIAKKDTGVKEMNIYIWGNICTKNGNYVVQCGAFKNKNNAMRLALYIKRSTNLAVGVILNNELYKVRVGCAVTRKDANRIKRKLMGKNGGDNIFIMINQLSDDTTSLSMQDYIIKVNANINELVDKNNIIWGDVCTQIGNYYVQCGAFKHKINATKLASYIKQNTDAIVGIVLNNGLFKVQVGCVTTKNEANEIRDKLIEKWANDNVFVITKHSTESITNPISKDTAIKDDLPVDQSNENTLAWGKICTQINNFYVQCGAFTSKNKAIKLALEIKQNTNETVGVILNNGLFKVQVGCFFDRNGADEIKNKLVEKGICDNMFIMIRK